MGEFKIIESQEDFDERISERLKREKIKFQEKIDELTAERDSFKTQVEEKEAALTANLTTLEDLQNKVGEKDQTISKYETEKMKTSIALKSGIPLDLVDKLSGSTQEEIEEDAKRLAGFIKPKGGVPPLRNLENNDDTEDSDAEYKQMLKKLNLI